MNDEIYAKSIILAVRNNPVPSPGWLEAVIISMLHSYVEERLSQPGQPMEDQ